MTLLMTTLIDLPKYWSFSFSIIPSKEWASLVPQRVKDLPAMQKTGVRSLGQENPLEKRMDIHFSILA